MTHPYQIPPGDGNQSPRVKTRGYKDTIPLYYNAFVLHVKVDGSGLWSLPNAKPLIFVVGGKPLGKRGGCLVEAQ